MKKKGGLRIKERNENISANSVLFRNINNQTLRNRTEIEIEGVASH